MTKISYQGYEPAHLSYSSIDGYRSCGMRFNLQKVLRVEQRPGVAALGGNAVHTATEWYDLAEWCAEDEDGVGRMFRDAWDQEVAVRREQSPSYTEDDYIVTGRATAEYGGKQNKQWWMDNGPGMVQNWIDWRQEHGWHLWETPEGNPAVELEINTIVGDHLIKMFIDRVMVTKAGQIVVLDLKTGRIPETPEQLGLYALGLEQTFGQMFRPDWGYYWDARKGSHGPPLDLSMYTADWFAEQARMVAAGVNAGCFLAKPMNNCKNWCGVAHRCPAVGGTLDTHDIQRKN